MEKVNVPKVGFVEMEQGLKKVRYLVLPANQCWTLQFSPGYPLALPQPGKTQSSVKVTLNTRRPNKLALGYLRPEVSCKVFAQISINLYH